MSFHDWPGPQLARYALRRIVDGKSAFAGFAANKRSFRCRRAAIEFLKDGGYIETTKRGPIATDAGRAEFCRKPRVGQYSPAELRLILERYRALGPAVLAKRLGRSDKAVSKQAQRLGVACRDAANARQRSGAFHYLEPAP